MRKATRNFSSNATMDCQLSSTQTSTNTSGLQLLFRQSVWNKLLMFLLVFVLSFSAKSQVDVSGTIAGTTPVTYTTLKDAFDAVNAGTHTGVITISITSSTTETAQAALNSSGTGSASYTAVTIKPATGVTATISGSISTSLVKLVGADNVTIDGSNTVGGTTKDLTFRNTNVGAAANTATPVNTTGAVIWLGSLASNGATGNTIKNCVIRGSAYNTCFAALASTSSTALTSSSVAANSNNTYTNNTIVAAQNTILVLGFTGETGLNISNNYVDSAFQNGMQIGVQTNFTISGNTLDHIENISATTSGTIHGIQLTSSVNTNGTVSNNKILKVRQNSSNTGVAYSARGLTMQTTSTAANMLVANNFVGDVSAVGIGTSLTVHGMLISGGNGWKIYHNTVNLTTPNTAPNSASSAFSINSNFTGTGALDIRNNIFANNLPSGTSNTNYYAFFSFYGVAGVANATAALQFLDNNVYFTNNNSLASNNPTQIANLASLQTLFGKDANSVSVQPTFTSSTDLHLSAVAGNASINNGGTPLGLVTTDIDGATRSTNYPDIGADEIVYIPKISGFTPASACAGGTVTINGADFTGVISSGVNLAGTNASSVNVVSTSQLTAVVAGGYSSPVSNVITVTNAFGTATSSSNLTRLAPGTYSSKSLTTASHGDEVIITGTNLTGASAVTFNGTTASFTVTNSTEIVAVVPVGSTTGNILITDACGNSINAGSITLIFGSPCTTPSAQPTSLVKTGGTTTTFTGSFTAASGSPSGYLVVYSTSALSGTPTDGTTYTVGSSLGGGTIAQISASTNVSISGLTGNTAYIVTVFAYNGGGCSGGPLYNTASPLVYNFISCPSIPTSVSATPVGNNTGNSINLSWSAPSGGTASSLTYSIEVTTDAAYTNAVSGSPFTTSSLSQSVTGLSFNTKYYYRIRANNGCYSSYVSSNATTVCGAITTLPLSENFNSLVTSALPTCWSTLDNNADGFTWSIQGITGVTGLTTPYSLRYLANTTTVSIAGDDYAFTPSVNLTGGVSYTVSFLQASFTNAGENLVVKYGTSATAAGMTNTIYSGAGLTNTAANYITATFTPTSSGTYYFGFYTNSPAYGNGTTIPRGGVYLYLDDIKIEVTPPAPTAPSNLTFPTVTSSSVTLNWTDNSSAETGYYVYSSTDGVTYTLANTVAANVTSSTISNLNANTQYWFKVTGYNAGGEGSGVTGSTTTADCGGVFTTNTFIGTLIPGTVISWNNASNWSLGHVPTSCENVVISPNNLPGSTTTINYLYLNANASMNNLTIAPTNSGTSAAGRQVLFIFTQQYKMNIGGNLLMSNDSVGGTTPANDNVLLIAGTGGSITVNGTADIGSTGNRNASIGGASGTGTITFKGDVVLGPQAFLNFAALLYYVFDANGNQVLTINSTQDDGTTTYGLGNLTVGNLNSTSLTLAGTGTSPGSAIVGDLTISNGSSLILPSGQQLNRTASGGTLTLGSNSLLKVGGSTGGAGNSNFPSNFSIFNIDNASTIEYNDTSMQDVSPLPTYGILKVNNAAGVSLTGNTTVNNNLLFTSGKVSTGSHTLTMGSSATVSGAGPFSYVNGTLAKTKTSGTNATLSFEIGDASLYSHVDVVFNGTTNAGGTFSAKTTAGNTGLGFDRSGISSSEYLNRYYTLNNNGVTGFSNLSAYLTYSGSDIVGAADNSGFRVADSVYGGGWTLLSGSIVTPTLSLATPFNLASGSTADFVVGNLAPVPLPTVNDPSPSSACEGASYVVTGSNFYGVTGVSIGATAVSTFVVNSPTQITITVPNGAASGVISVTNSAGTASSTNTLTTNEQPQTTVSISTQTICSGVAITDIVLGNSTNISGTTYSWTRTLYASSGTVGSSGTTNPSGTMINAVTIPVLDTFTVTSLSPLGCVGTIARSTVTVKASPGTVTVTPTSANVCQTVAQQLSSTVVAATGSSVSNTGTIALAIPDGVQTGVNTTLNVSNIPTGAVITGVDVQFSITHGYNSDLIINLTAPNGKTLNLANQVGGTGTNFLNTIISSTSATPLPVDDASDITGTFAPDLFGAVGPTQYKSNAFSFSELYSSPNGLWRLSLRDIGTPDAGTLTNYKLTIYYTLSPTFSWTPQSGLYTDAGFTQYTGGSNSTVYAKNVAGNYAYNARITFNGCTVNSDTVHIDVDATPIATRTPSSQSICSGNAITDITFGTSNSISGTTFSWTRDHSSDVSGTIGDNGTGDISGTLVNTTSSPITVTFTITPIGPGGTACPGADVTSTVIVNPRPIATATPATQGVCSGFAIGQISFGTSNNISGTSYAWTRDNTTSATGIASSGNSFVSGTLTNTTGSSVDVTFTVTPTGPAASGSCSGTPTTAVVTLSYLPNVYTVSGGGSYCSPGAGLPVNLSNSQSGVNYQLKLDGVDVGSPMAGTGSAISFGNQTAAGTYTVSASNGGCTLTMTGSAVIVATTTVTPTISIAANTTSVCTGTNVTFFAIATDAGSTPVYNFAVNGVSKQSGSSNVYITNALLNGDVVNCTLTSNNTCQSASSTTSNDVTITVSPLPTVAPPSVISGTTTQCTIGAVTYLADATPNGVWSSTNTSVATILYNGKVTAIGNGNAIINYTVTGVNGCSNSASVIYTVSQLDAPAAITGTNRICKGATTTLSCATTGGVWSSLNNAATVSNTGVVTGVYGGGTVPALIRYTVTNGIGCSKYASYNVTVNAVPNVPTFGYASGTTNPQTGAGGGFCINRTFTLVGNPSGGTWASSNPTVASVTSPAGVCSTRALGSVSITYTYTNVNGCSASRSISGTIVNCAGARGVDINTTVKNDTDFTLFPNPAKGSVTFNTEYAIAGGKIAITDLYGKQLKVQALSIGTNSIDISNLSKGFYLVSMITTDGKITKKLIVE